MSQWYYADAAQQRLGPIPEPDLVDLHRQGRLRPDTLVWRDGLADWVPWRDAMSEVIDARTDDATPGRQTEPAPLPGDRPASNPYAFAEPTTPYAPPRTGVADASDYVAGGAIVDAGFWKRVAAYTIDSFLLMVLIGAAMFVLSLGGMASLGLLTGDPSALAGMGFGMIAFIYLVQIGLTAAYFAWFHASARQATPGKMAVGIKVTDEHGRRISMARGIGRFFATLISSLILGIGYLMAAFTQRKRALHDMVAGTLVVDQWAYTAHPERQSTELGTVTKVVLIIAGLLVIAYFGFIALAIGIALSMGAG